MYPDIRLPVWRFPKVTSCLPAGEISFTAPQNRLRVFAPAALFRHHRRLGLRKVALLWRSIPQHDWRVSREGRNGAIATRPELPRDL